MTRNRNVRRARGFAAVRPRLVAGLVLAAAMGTAGREAAGQGAAKAPAKPQAKGPAAAAPKATEKEVADARQLLADRKLTLVRGRYLLDEDGALKGHAAAEASYIRLQKADAAYANLMASDAAVEGARQERDARRQMGRGLRAEINDLNYATRQPGMYRRLGRWITPEQIANRQANLANKASIEQLESMLRDARPDKAAKARRQEIVDQLSAASVDCLEALRRVESEMDAIAGAYDALKADPKVRDAIVLLDAQPGSNVRLGPSDKFEKAYGQIRKARKELEPEAAPEPPAPGPKKRRRR